MLYWLCLLVLCLFSQLQESYQQASVDACTHENVPSDEWASQLEFFNPTATSVMLSWTITLCHHPRTLWSTEYVTAVISSHWLLGALSPILPSHWKAWTYSVQVCRPNTTTVISDECGHCRLCIATAEVPEAVENVRVFLFRPNRDRSVITGLVFWDRMNAQNHTIQVFEEGSNTSLPNLFAPNFNKTSYVIIQKTPRSRLVFPNGQVTYPIQLGQTYQVTVSATNLAGSGPSSLPVNFTADDSQFFPEQIVARTVNCSLFFGERLDINQPLSISGGGPIVVDAIERNVFWFSLSANTIYSQSLHSGMQEPFLPIPPEKVMAALAFDWVGDELYMMRVIEGATSPSRLEIYSVSVFNREVVNNVFPNLAELVDSGSSFQLVMNPFTGFLYMIETTPTGATSLKAYNLREKDTREGNTLFTSSQNRQKRRRSSRMASSRLRRQTSLDLVPSLTSALAQDPFTGELLLCNEDTGDILRCNVSITPPSCSVEVMRDALANATPGHVVGLPADNIAINEDRLYWSNADGIFSVSRASSIGSEPVTVVSNSTQSAQIVSPNPGLQLISANQNCLSATFFTVMERPEIRRDDFQVTNTTIKMFWDLNASPVCDEEFFSVPPYTFVAIHELSMQGPRFDFFTYAQSHLFENLEPFSSCFVSVLVSNEFTITVPVFVSARTQVRVATLEGVPNQADNIVADVMGTSSIQLSWDAVSGPENLRGENARYFLVFPNGEVNTTLTTHTLTNSEMLIPGAQQVVKLIVGNDVLNSTPSSLTVTLWSLVLAPERVDGTNTTLNLSITIPNDGRFELVQSVNSMYCLHTRASLSGEQCSCLMESGRRIMDDFLPVKMPLPYSAMFSITNLMPNTEYCVQSIGNYGTEVTPGEGRIVKTDSGVPDAPTATREAGSNILMWSMPSGNGEPITQYIIIATTNSNKDPIESQPLFAEVTEFNLDNLVDVGQLYEVAVRASNRVGQGPPSNTVAYLRQSSEIGLRSLAIPEIVGIIIAVVFLTVIISAILVVFCFLQCRTSKQDKKGLSYMYDPDHELSNFREAYRNAQSSNTCSTALGLPPPLTAGITEVGKKKGEPKVPSVYIRNMSKSVLLIPGRHIQLLECVGKGEFGVVYKGHLTGWQKRTTPELVAVKTLNGTFSPSDITELLKESEKMMNFHHQNVLSLIGVCVDAGEVPYIIMPFMANGSLLMYLRKSRPDLTVSEVAGEDMVSDVQRKLLVICLQIAQGMAYLADQKFVHRDLAAQNCMVDKNFVIKVADFGLTENVCSRHYFKQPLKQQSGMEETTAVKLPIKWLALESLLDGIFSEKSDVWSFGVTCWEVFSLGHTPYPAVGPYDLVNFLKNGGKLEKPANAACSQHVYDLISKCWLHSPNDRPTFTALVDHLNSFLKNSAGYLDLNEFHCEDSCN